MGDIALRNYFFAYNAAAYQLAGLAVQAFPFPDHLERAIEIREALWVDFDADPGETTEQGDKLRNALRHLSGGARPAFEEGFGPWQNTLFGRGAGDGTLDGIFGQIAVNTSGFVYQLDDDPALSAEEVAFNVDVFRVDGDFLANNPVRSDGVRAMPILAGRFDVPVVTLHTLGDLFVPFSMEQIYAERAQANGSGSWLVQRAIRATGHCGFDTDEVTAAFQAMVNWSENGTVPEGDIVLDPDVVALPSYGCRFTTVTRPGIPDC
jgi:hypothetical protein